MTKEVKSNPHLAKSNGKGKRRSGPNLDQILQWLIGLACLSFFFLVYWIGKTIVW